MFIGHYAPALALATDRRAPSLGALFVAAQAVDVAYFAFVLGGIEHMRETPGITAMNAGDFYHFPYTHSLVGSLGFSLAWAIGARLLRRGWATAAIGAVVVASHWLLDLIVHAPDLTLLGSGRRYGLALWNHPAIEMPLELALTFGALLFYARRTRPRGRHGDMSLIVLALALAALQAVDWSSPKPTMPVDPVPASVPLAALVAYAALAALAWWTGAMRTRRAGPAISTL